MIIGSSYVEVAIGVGDLSFFEDRRHIGYFVDYILWQCFFAFCLTEMDAVWAEDLNGGEAEAVRCDEVFGWVVGDVGAILRFDV